MASTRSPTWSDFTFAPTSATTPAGSLPGTNGSSGRNWYWPPITRRSTKFAAVAWTSSRISFGAGSGLGNSPSSASSTGPNSRTITARIVAAPLFHCPCDTSQEPRPTATPSSVSTPVSTAGRAFTGRPHRLRDRAPFRNPVDDVPLAHLAARRQRDVVDLQHVFGHVLFGKAHGVEMRQHLRRLGARAGAPHHGEADFLAEPRVGDRHGRGALGPWMPQC